MLKSCSSRRLIADRGSFQASASGGAIGPDVLPTDPKTGRPDNAARDSNLLGYSGMIPNTLLPMFLGNSIRWFPTHLAAFNTFWLIGGANHLSPECQPPAALRSAACRPSGSIVLSTRCVQAALCCCAGSISAFTWLIYGVMIHPSSELPGRPFQCTRRQSPPPFSPPLHLTTPSNVLWRGGSDQCRTSADWAWAWDADPWYQPGAGELPAGALHQQPQQSDDQADTARRQRWAHLIPGGAAVWAPSFRAPNEPEEPRGDGAGAGAGAVCCDKLLFGKGVTAAERAALAAMAAGEPGERAEEPAGPKEPLQWRGAGLAPVQV